MPNRIIKESCRTSATLFKLSDAAERLFWRLVTVADDFGRFEADPAVMKAQCFPRWPDSKMSPKRVAALYAELEREIVQTYVVKGVHYGYFLTWDQHQQKRAKRSKYPEPSEENLLPASASTCKQMIANVPEKREARSEKREARSEKRDTDGVWDRFEEVWKEYPRKDSKKEAREAWGELKPDAALTGVILAAVQAQKTWPERAKENFRYFPYFQRWLKKRRWEDEPPALTNGASVSRRNINDPWQGKTEAREVTL